MQRPGHYLLVKAYKRHLSRPRPDALLARCRRIPPAPTSPSSPEHRRGSSRRPLTLSSSRRPEGQNEALALVVSSQGIRKNPATLKKCSARRPERSLGSRRRRRKVRNSNQSIHASSVFFIQFTCTPAAATRSHPTSFYGSHAVRRPWLGFLFSAVWLG